MRKFFLLGIILCLLFSSLVLAKEDNDITLSLAGDVMMDGSVGLLVGQHGYDYPWLKVADYFRASDLSIINLETSITSAGQIWPDKQFNFRSNPANLDAMKAAGIDMVVLANNHVLDYDREGLTDTINHLRTREISYVGGGKNLEEALRGAIINKKGKKIGVLAFSRVIPHVGWYAGPNRSGVVGAYDGNTQAMFRRIEEMKKEVDILVLSLHWGIERSLEPRPEDIKIAKAAIDAGVDIVMGHHPHVLQGVEIYKGKPIFYSLGNFVFGSADPLTRTTMIGQVLIKDRGLDKVKLIPCTIVNGRPVPLEGKEGQETILYMEELSKAYNTNIDSQGIIDLQGKVRGKKVNINHWKHQIIMPY